MRLNLRSNLYLSLLLALLLAMLATLSGCAAAPGDQVRQAHALYDATSTALVTARVAGAIPDGTWAKVKVYDTAASAALSELDTAYQEWLAAPDAAKPPLDSINVALRMFEGAMKALAAAQQQVQTHGPSSRPATVSVNYHGPQGPARWLGGPRLAVG